MLKYIKSAIGSVVNATFDSAQSSIRFVGIVFTCFTNTAINLGAPFLLVTSFDRLTNKDADDDQEALLYVGGYAALWATGRLIQAYRIAMLGGTTTRLAHKLTTDIVEKYYEQPMQYRVAGPSTIESQLFINTYKDVAGNFVTASMSRLLPSTIEILAATGIVLYRYNLVGVFLLGTASLFVISTKISSSYIAKSRANWNTNAFMAYDSVTMRLSRYENARYFGKTDFEILELHKSLNTFDNAHKKAENTREFANAIQSLVLGAGYAGTICWSVYKVTKGEIDSKDIVWLVLYLTQFAQSLDEISKAFNQINESFVSYRDIFDYIHKQHDFSDDRQKPSLVLTRETAKIEFNNVTFRYSDKTDNVLDGINFSIEPGEKVAIIGESGSGKTTILQLLLGFYNPTLGNITINGVDITSVNRSSINSAIAVIPQTPYLFNTTFRNNLKYAYELASEHDLQEALDKSYLSSVVKRFGSERKIGEEGKQVSGGQRQRISIGRAFLKLKNGASIVIADEATSALDPQTEEIVMNEIFELCRTSRATCLFVTHNLRNLKADKIDKVIVLDKGQIKEAGSVGELMKKQGFFSKQLKAAKLKPDDLLQTSNSNSHNIEVFDAQMEEDETQVVLSDENTPLIKEDISSSVGSYTSTFPSSYGDQSDHDYVSLDSQIYKLN